MITTILILITLLFGMYFAISVFELGLVLQYTGSGSKTEHNERPFRISPIWELSNFILVFGGIGFVISFKPVVAPLLHDIGAIFIIGFVALLVRIITLVFLFYFRKGGQFFWTSVIILTLACITVPMSMGLSGISLLTGTFFWQNSVDWIMAACLLLNVFSLGFAAMYYSVDVGVKRLVRLPMHVITTLYCVLVAIGLQVVVNNSYQLHLISGFYGFFVLLVAATAFVQVVLKLINYDYLLWCYLFLVTILSPVLLALSNRPYIVFPSVGLVKAFGPTTYAPTITISLLIIFILIALGLFLFLLAKFSQSPKKSSHRVLTRI